MLELVDCVDSTVLLAFHVYTDMHCAVLCVDDYVTVHSGYEMPVDCYDTDM